MKIAEIFQLGYGHDRGDYDHKHDHEHKYRRGHHHRRHYDRHHGGLLRISIL